MQRDNGEEPSIEEIALSEFLRAISLCEHGADSAAVHMLLEQTADDRWSNVYTSVTYGPDADLSSIPTNVEEAQLDGLALLRVRVPIADAKHFVDSASAGSARFDVFEIDFACEETLEGFRPRYRWNREAADAFNSAPSWRREHIGTRKSLGDLSLSDESVYQIVERLSMLNQARWLGIPLLLHPEKLGDLDEVWPSPARLKATGGADGAGIDVYLEDDRLRLDPSRLALSGTAYKHGMISSSIAETGAFPKRLTVGDSVDLRLFVDGVLFDQISGHFVKAVVTQLAFGSSTILQVPAYKSRPQTEVAVGASAAQEIRVGAPGSLSTRAAAWEVGRKFRDEQVPEDAERVYDVTINPAAVRDAFADLGNFGKAQRGKTMTIVDPYALDAQALYSIIAAALPYRKPSSVVIYTAFRISQTARSPEGAATRVRKRMAQLLRKAFRRRKSLVKPALSQRDQVRADFFSVAQQVSDATKVAIAIYDAPQLHDRFMLLGDRIWHVGPSFNTLGQDVAAIVEMRDPRRKAQVRAYLRRHATNPLWQTT